MGKQAGTDREEKKESKADLSNAREVENGPDQEKIKPELTY